MRVLLADDEKSIVVTLGDALTGAGHQVRVANTGTEALAALDEEEFDCVLTDVRMPGADGIAVLRHARSTQKDCRVIVITAFGSVESAVEAMKLGASDYLRKPFLNEEVTMALERMERVRQLESDNLRLRREVEKTGLGNMVGAAPRMREVFDLIETLAPSDVNVLVEGESGTGKELVAHALHAGSERRTRSLVKLSCAVFPENLLEDELFGHEKGAFTDAKDRKIGRFERANGGTIFLDDIDDMSPPLQVKLLRVLQEREFERLGGERTIPVDIRVVAATKVDLAEAVAGGSFREDLYYRLNVVTVRLPPLRDRLEDIPLLVDAFIERYSRGRTYRLEERALGLVEQHRWPGNIRELENAVQRAIALAGPSDVLRVQHLLRSHTTRLAERAESTDLKPLREALMQTEREHILEALRRAKGKRAEAAELLGISRKGLWVKIRELGLEEKIRGLDLG